MEPVSAALESAAARTSPNVFLQLLPITAAVFIAFLTIGLALPVLPLHVHETLGFSTLVVGIIVGCQFGAALVSRVWAGGYADTRGAKRGMLIGCIVSAGGGLIYLISLTVLDRPLASVILLLIGRIVLGCGESFVTTGALSWGVGLVGPQNAGKVMAWVGMAMYAAYAVGAPVGTALYGQSGFMAISLATLLIPILALTIVLPVTSIAPPPTRRAPFYTVVAAVWRPGLGLVFASIGFGAITTFIALHFAQRGWGGASLTFTIFGAAFILARIFFGGTPDRLGGAKVALVSVAVEALGQALIWAAPTTAVVFLGAALTGFGYSLAFPGFGVEAVRRAPPQSRGLAMGAYVAFMDVALGIAGPALGFVADQNGVQAVYLASTIAVLSAVPVAAMLMAKEPRKQRSGSAT